MNNITSYLKKQFQKITAYILSVMGKANKKKLPNKEDLKTLDDVLDYKQKYIIPNFNNIDDILDFVNENKLTENETKDLIQRMNKQHDNEMLLDEIVGKIPTSLIGKLNYLNEISKLNPDSESVKHFKKFMDGRKLNDDLN
jgi:benzoyl-CoA reductase/2-hydroxyglutaryl-CoA dehydratase subunit BcrC/BadD/HgdB